MKKINRTLLVDIDKRMTKIVEHIQVSLFGIAVIGPDKQKYLSAICAYFLIYQIKRLF